MPDNTAKAKLTYRVCTRLGIWETVSADAFSINDRTAIFRDIGENGIATIVAAFVDPDMIRAA